MQNILRSLEYVNLPSSKLTVNDTVAVVVDPIGGLVPALGIESGLARVAPHVVSEILVIVVDSCVDDADDDVFAAGAHIPGGEGH